MDNLNNLSVFSTPQTAPTAQPSKKRKYWKIFLLVLLGIIVYFVWGSPSSIKSSLVPGTVGFKANQIFNFTISPDGNWLVALPGGQPEYGLLALNLKTGKSFKFPLNEYNANEEGNIWEFRNECWSEDSRYCVFPVIYLNSFLSEPDCRTGQDGQTICFRGTEFKTETAEKNRSSIPRIIMDFTGEIPIVKEQDNYRNVKVAENPDSYIKIKDLNPSGRFTCSDCSSLGEIFPGEISSETSVSANQNRSMGFSIIPRGEDKYYISASGKKVNIIKENNSGKKEVVYSAFGLVRDVHLEYLSLSRDGNRLAFLESRGFGSFVGSPTLKAIDLMTKKVLKISDTVYYDIHWSPDSKRIYYYHCQEAGNCGNVDGIYFSDL